MSQEEMTKMRATGTGFLASQIRVREGDVFMYPSRFIVYDKESGRQLKPTWAVPYSDADVPKKKVFNIPGMKQKATVLSRRAPDAAPKTDVPHPEGAKAEGETAAPAAADSGRASDESVI